MTGAARDAVTATRSAQGARRSPPAWLVALCVAPCAALGALGTDRACNHLEGDVSAAEPGTPRGRWCATVEPGHHPWVLLAGPVLAAFALVVLLSLAPRLRAAPVRWGVAGLLCAAALAQLWVVGTLRPINEL